MKWRLSFSKLFSREVSGLLLALLLLTGLLLYKLGSLVHGLSGQEISTATSAVGWHGIYHNAFYLPLKVARSVVFVVFPDHGQTLTRLPNTLFGAAATLALYYLLRAWHGKRTALLLGILFATSAWTLHVSRLASFDVLYLAALPLLLLSNHLFHKHPGNPLIIIGSLLLWLSLLYVPGLVWLVALNTYWLWEDLLTAAKQMQQLWQQLTVTFLVILSLPLLVVQLLRSGSFVAWLGLPAHWPSLVHLGKQFVGVFVHLFVRGPQYPQLWLARSPILDIFSLVMCVIGLYFYATHLEAFRSRLLMSFAAIGIILVALGGSVPLSLLVPLLYISVAAGIAYILHEWLQVFPLNPLARGLGIGLIFAAVGLATIYNLRAYFVAWPHNQATPAIFRYHR